MKRMDRTRQGIAAVEFALMLPVMALLFFILVEGANAMHAYSNLVEASREGARMALMDGTPADIEALVHALTDSLDTDALTTSVVTDPANNTVTVEVSYVYQPFGEDAMDMLTDNGPFQMVAQTTMPLP